MIYLDSNVFIFAALNNERLGDEARIILEKVERGEVIAASSSLTFDELVWIIKKNRTYEDAIAIGEALLDMPKLRLTEVNGDLLALALSLMKKYRLDPRDSIHAATSIKEKADLMISEDTDFDRVKEFRRQGIEKFKTP